jgi:hypothetical protein
MKKIIALAGVVAVLFLAVVAPALAQTNVGPVSSCTISATNVSRMSALGVTCSQSCDYSGNTGSCGLCCILNTVYTFTDWAFFILLAIAVFYIILAGIKFVTSGDNPDEVAKARSMILYAAVGIGVALLARAVPSMVKFVLGGQ